MKQKIGLTIGVIVILASILLLTGCYVKYRRDLSGVVETMIAEATYVSPANCHQWRTSIWMDIRNETMMVASCSSGHGGGGRLYMLQNGNAERKASLFRTGNATFCGRFGNYLYYWAYKAHRDAAILCCCNLNSGKVTELYTDSVEGPSPAYQDKDGSVLVPLALDWETDTQLALRIRGSEVLEKVTHVNSYMLGDRYYYVADTRTGIQVFCREADGTEEELKLAPGQRRFLIPTENGLLIHNQGRQALLYFIDSEGNCEEMFSVPCSFSESAVTIYHDVVYLSAFRYEKGSSTGLGFVGYEDDTLSGTYRINLRDFSVEKLNDLCYIGMYIFDDDKIFACSDDYQIDILDHDGTIIGHIPIPFW